MVKFKCKNCGYEDEIKFGVVGYGLIDLTVTFKCKECGCAGVLYVKFRDKAENEIKVTLEKPNYFG